MTLEIFPVFLSDGEPFVLIPEGEDSWRLPQSGTRHGHEIVRQELLNVALEPLVIHSTSWRQEEDKLFLTYLAVLTNLERAPEGFAVFPVTQSGLARGGATSPPEIIPSSAVINHALQHLAWLYQTDTAVREALPDGWDESLSRFQAQPARSLGEETW